MDNKSKVILFICGMIIIYIVTDLIMAHMSHKPLFDWWNENGGSAYSDKFSLSTCMMSYYSTPLYYLSKLTISPQEFLTLAQISFLVGNIFPYLRSTDANGVQSGILLPRHLCESVLLKTSDGDTLFNTWYQSSDTNRDENSDLVYDPPTSATVTDSNGNTYNTLTFGSPKPDSTTNLIGVYPSASDTNSWMGLIAEWGGPNLRWQPDESKKFYSPEPLPTKSDGSDLDWFNYQSTGAPRPDNFLARMGIPPDSPLVVYFCTGKYSVNGVLVDASAFLNLLQPAGANPGGWIGYIRGRGPTTSYDDLRNYIYTRVDWLAAPNKPCDSSGSTFNGITAGLSSAVPGLLMTLPMIMGASAFLTGPFAFLAVAAVVGVGALSGIKAANASNC